MLPYRMNQPADHITCFTHNLLQSTKKNHPDQTNGEQQYIKTNPIPN